MDALDYVERRRSEFSGVSLAVSFSLAVLKIVPRSYVSRDPFKIGYACSTLELHNMYLVRTAMKGDVTLWYSRFSGSFELLKVSWAVRFAFTSSQSLVNPCKFRPTQKRKDRCTSRV